MPALDRREFVRGSAALALLGLAVPVPANPPLSVPEVDALDLQIVVDNATFGPFLPDLSLPGMRVLRAERAADPAAPRMDRRTLVAEFGLSILAHSRIGNGARRVLVDFGYTPAALSNNLALLGLDPAGIDAAVLSHGHLDHYGGFPGLFGAAAAPARRIPLFVGGEEIFCERVATVGNPPPVMGALPRAALAEAGFDIRLAAEPAIVADHAFTTGVIPLRTSERPAIPTRMRPGVGCRADALSPAKRGPGELADDAEHELATCYAVRGLGLVVIASCSHRGVINSILRAQAVSGIERVHAVVGGFHLVRPRTEAEARETVAELARIDPRYIVPMHCSGDVFIAEATRLMPEKVVKPYVGTRLVMGSV